MGKVIYLNEVRARLAGEKSAILSPRPRSRGRERAAPAASDLSAELMRLLMKKKRPTRDER